MDRPKWGNQLTWKRGDVIGQKYEVLRILGEGGFGLVYLVDSRETGEVYALKTFRDEYIGDAKVRELFGKEAQAWINIGNHPYVVRAYFVDLISGRLYIGMEYIAPDERGLNSLASYLFHAPPDLRQSLIWGIQFCYGMEHAYQEGIRCHRDIKPTNIMINQDKIVKITDFGLAGLLDVPKDNARQGLGTSLMKATSAGRTLEGPFGTPAYMPPEQFDSVADCDERSDIYSFGVVLYQMATRGDLPFLPEIREGNVEIPTDQVFAELRILHRTKQIPHVDTPLFPIIEKCLAKQPNERYPTFKELRLELNAILKNKYAELIDCPRLAEYDEREWTRKGLSLFSIGRYSEALHCYDKALEINQDHFTAWNNKANVLDTIGEHDQALLCIDRAIEINPRHTYAWNNRGRILRKLGRLNEALVSYDKALEYNPENVAAWHNKGICFHVLGRHTEALRFYDRAIEIDPRNAEVYFNKSTSLRSLGRIEEALLVIDICLKLDPRMNKGWFSKGFSLAKVGKDFDAIECFDKELELEPEDADSLKYKAISLGKLGRAREALSCLEKALKIAPEDPDIFVFKIIALVGLDRRQEALECADEGLRIHPQSEDLLSNKGFVLMSLGKHQEAIGNLDMAIRINPQFPIAWINKGQTLKRMANYRDALSCIDKALQIDPLNAGT
jgi:tetratricopeptide (TPR) repeat protein